MIRSLSPKNPPQFSTAQQLTRALKLLKSEQRPWLSSDGYNQSAARGADLRLLVAKR